MADPKRRARPVYELSWNHTTLHALKIDPTITCLQVLYPPPVHVERALEMHRHYDEEVMIHLEFVGFEGQIACFGLPIVRFTTENRLDEIIRFREDHGCPIFNPHAFTPEEGGTKQVDHPSRLQTRKPTLWDFSTPARCSAGTTRTSAAWTANPTCTTRSTTSAEPVCGRFGISGRGVVK